MYKNIQHKDVLVHVKKTFVDDVVQSMFVDDDYYSIDVVNMFVDYFSKHHDASY
jgi:hypothetical protein